MLMDVDYCRARAATCRESAVRPRKGEPRAGWLYLADLWERLAEAAEQQSTVH
jgi:hypothetical protein